VDPVAEKAQGLGGWGVEDGPEGLAAILDRLGPDKGGTIGRGGDGLEIIPVIGEPFESRDDAGVAPILQTTSATE
jgi:hypothetical protein